MLECQVFITAGMTVIITDYLQMQMHQVQSCMIYTKSAL